MYASIYYFFSLSLSLLEKGKIYNFQENISPYLIRLHEKWEASIEKGNTVTFNQAV